MMTATEINFTDEQMAILRTLPASVCETLLTEYPSVAENFLFAREFPDLPKGYDYQAFEVYYDLEDMPRIHIEGGVSVAIPKPPVEDAPRIIEMMNEATFVFIQVDGHVILNRMNGNMPTLNEIQVEV
jgi:hypothetical protein